MRDIYRSGKFNEAIDIILRNAATVRRVYKEVSNSDRSENWFPFQTVCEKCGRIGTTEVFAYDGKEVSYRCRPDMVKWARGCGHEGKCRRSTDAESCRGSSNGSRNGSASP